jgi:hypothetical protein
MQVIENYKRALESSDEQGLRDVFAPQVRIEVPAGASLTPSVGQAAHIMSQVARTAPGIRCSVTADAGGNWYFLGFDGELEGEKLQAIDHVHLNGHGQIDHLIIYMRPIPVAQKFANAIGQRLQPAK